MQEQNGQVTRKTQQNKGIRTAKSSNSQTNADVVNEREDGHVSENQTDNTSAPANSLQSGMYMVLSAAISSHAACSSLHMKMHIFIKNGYIRVFPCNYDVL